IAQGHQYSSASARFATAMKIMDKTDCYACHKPAEKSVGPSYREVALKYKEQAGAIDLLAGRVINGSTGVWGEVAMAAHPALSQEDASELIKYILSFSEEKTGPAPLPAKGEYQTTVPADDKGIGVYMLRAAYSDRGAPGLPSLSAEKIYILRNSTVGAHDVDFVKNAQKMTFSGMKFCIPSDNGYAGLNDVDLSGLVQVKIGAMAPKKFNFSGGTIEMHLDAPDGPLAGEPVRVEPTDEMAPSISTLKLNQSATGIHDVYFVFKSEGAAAAQALMTVTEFSFQDEQSQATEASVAVAVPAESDLNDYDGTYIFTGLPFDKIEFLVENGVLIASSSMNKGPVKQTGTDTFDADGKAVFQFVRENGKVTGVKLMPPGMSFFGKKQ
ncbi:MAG: c-type cytochrome, partial [Bacteroidota bacterium]